MMNQLQPQAPPQNFCLVILYACGSIYKWSICILNALYFFHGCATFGAGIWVLADKTQLTVLFQSTPNGNPKDFDSISLLDATAALMMAGSTFVVIVGFMGCWGAMRSPKLLLFLYGTLVVIVLVDHIIAGLMGIIAKDKVRTELKDNLIKNIEENYDGELNSTRPFTQSLDYAQVYFECCGIVDATKEFQNAWLWMGRIDYKVPETCCVIGSKSDFFMDNIINVLSDPCQRFPSVYNSYVHQPCFDQIGDWLEFKTDVLIGLCFSSVLILISGLVMSCFILKTMLEVKGRL